MAQGGHGQRVTAGPSADVEHSGRSWHTERLATERS
jgi:hypothetical protein